MEIKETLERMPQVCKETAGTVVVDSAELEALIREYHKEKESARSNLSLWYETQAQLDSCKRLLESYRALVAEYEQITGMIKSNR